LTCNQATIFRSFLMPSITYFRIGLDRIHLVQAPQDLAYLVQAGRNPPPV
jgi:hypothetical protein